MTNTVNAVDLKFKSLSQMAQNQAMLDDTLNSHAEFAIQTIAGFPESKPSDEEMEQLNNGYHKQYQATHPNKVYARVDNALVEFDTLTKEQQAKVKEKITVGVDFALSFTQQAFGKLRSDKEGGDLALHAVLKEWRDNLSDYRNAKFKNLVNKAKAIINKGAKRERKATDDFIVRLKNVFDTLEKQCKTAQGRGDTTADPKLLKQAKLAFMTKYNHS